MLMLKIHIQYIFNMLCSMFLLSVLELVAAPARTQLAMTFLECLSSSSVTLNLLHMHIQYLKTSKLQNYGFNVVMQQQQQYMYVMYIVDMYFICFCCGFSFQLVGGKTRECCCCLWGVVETWWFFFCVVETCFNRLEIHIFLLHTYIVLAFALLLFTRFQL